MHPQVGKMLHSARYKNTPQKNMPRSGISSAGDWPQYLRLSGNTHYTLHYTMGKYAISIEREIGAVFLAQVTAEFEKYEQFDEISMLAGVVCRKNNKEGG